MESYPRCKSIRCVLCIWTRNCFFFPTAAKKKKRGAGVDKSDELEETGVTCNLSEPSHGSLPSSNSFIDTPSETAKRGVLVLSGSLKIFAFETNLLQCISTLRIRGTRGFKRDYFFLQTSVDAIWPKSIVLLCAAYFLQEKLARHEVLRLNLAKMHKKKEGDMPLSPRKYFWLIFWSRNASYWYVTAIRLDSMFTPFSRVCGLFVDRGLRQSFPNRMASPRQ